MKRIYSIDAIDAVAEELLRAVSPQENTATLVTLSGDLGAGKTTLSQAIGRALGVKETIVSPTFVIMKRYATKDARFSTLVHIDAYRLKGKGELVPLGWEMLLREPRTLILLEWPERVEGAIPKIAFPIVLSHEGDEERYIDF